MLIRQANGHELEIVAYEGEVRWGRDVTGDLRLLSIHPQHPVNFVIGQILEPFTYGRQPTLLQSPVILGRMMIHQVQLAWLGVCYQLIGGDLFYETDEVFTTDENWEESPMPKYLIRSRGSPKPYGQWFDFRVSARELLQKVGWDIPEARVCRMGLVGDVRAGGHCSFSLESLEVS